MARTALSTKDVEIGARIRLARLQRSVTQQENGALARAHVPADGWAEMQSDGSLVGWVSFDDGEELDFIARPWGGFAEIHQRGLLTSRCNQASMSWPGP